MKLPLNESMLLTKKEIRGGIILPFIVSLLAIMLGDLILKPFGFSVAAANPTMMDSLIGLFADIIPIVVVLLFCRFIQKRSLQSLGIEKKDISKSYMIGALIGLVLICATFLINLIFNGISTSVNPEGISWTFVIVSIFAFMIQSFNEELIFRGLLMNTIASKKGPLAGIIFNALFFGILHLLNPSVTFLSFANIILFGLLFSLIFYKTNSIWVVGAIHFIWNYFQGVIFGSQVSGLSLFSSVFKTMPVSGKELLNGGAFGFEGSFTVTIVGSIAIIVSLVLVKKKVQD